MACMETDKFIFNLRDDILLIRLKIAKTKDKYFLTYNFYTLGGFIWRQTSGRI